MRKSIAVNFALLSIIASSLVPPSRAQTATQPAPAGPNWKINCPGVRNVPMTADPEQSLPLQVIATLKCGEDVTVLDNNEGYTVKIKTADGKIGFVAAIFVKKISAPRRPPSFDSATMENGVARWQGKQTLNEAAQHILPCRSNLQPSSPTTRLPAPSGSNVARIRSS